MKITEKTNETVDVSGINLFYLGIYSFIFIIIVCFRPEIFSGSRWNTFADINGSGSFTITDALKWAYWIFSLPGDVVIQFSMKLTGLANFFELSTRSFGQAGSIVLSLCYWWLMGGRKMLTFWLSILAFTIFYNIPPLPVR